MISLFRRKKPRTYTYDGPTKFLWNKGMAMLCDKYDFSHTFNPKSYSNIQPGDLVWVKAHFVEEFLALLPEIENPFVLITGDSTRSLPKELKIDDKVKLLNNPKLLSWFAQNFDMHDDFGFDLSSEVKDRIFPIPLGIDFHSQYEKTSWRYKHIKSPADQESFLESINAQPIKDKIPLAYADFQLNNSSRLLMRRDAKIKKNRKMIYNDLKGNKGVYFQKKRITRDMLWREMIRYQFVISPHGSGLDCHRTWEALALGLYLIVEHSPLDPLYAGLPVKILEDYREISSKNLELWSDELQQKYHFSEYSQYLTNSYWISKIKRASGNPTIYSNPERPKFSPPALSNRSSS